MRAFLFSFLTSLLAVFGLNQAMSARGSDARVLELSRAQTADELIIAPRELEARAWVKARLESEDGCPDVLVLGSSTMGHFSSEMFPGKRFLGGWMGGPTIEDFEAVAALLRERSCRPETIVIGVDPWWIGNPEVNDQRWVSLFQEYVAYHADEGPLTTLRYGAPVVWNLFQDRLTFVTTSESVETLRHELRHDEEEGPRIVEASPDELCATLHGEYAIRSYDGHYITCPVFANAPAEVERRARDYLRMNKHHMGSWSTVATGRIRRLGVFLHDWTRSSRVVIVGMPYHPITYAAIRDDGTVSRNLVETDRLLATAAQDSGASFLNLRDATLAGCEAASFEDSHHPGDACVANVARKINEVLASSSSRSSSGAAP